MKFITTCGLLVALTATTALAQTHPRKKPHRRPVVGHKPVQVVRERPTEDYSIICYLPFEVPVERQETISAQADSNRVYTYVEQMPTLDGQTGLPAFIAAINQHLVVPPTAPDGRVFVRFEISKRGQVMQPKIAKGLRADVDSAVVAATRQLPRFTPGRHKGDAVAVSITLPVTFPAKRP